MGRRVRRGRPSGALGAPLPARRRGSTPWPSHPRASQRQGPAAMARPSQPLEPCPGAVCRRGRPMVTHEGPPGCIPQRPRVAVVCRLLLSPRGCRACGRIGHPKRRLGVRAPDPRSRPGPRANGPSMPRPGPILLATRGRLRHPQPQRGVRDSERDDNTVCFFNPRRCSPASVPPIHLVSASAG